MNRDKAPLQPSERHLANSILLGCAVVVGLVLGWWWLTMGCALILSGTLAAFGEARAHERRTAAALMFRNTLTRKDG